MSAMASEITIPTIVWSAVYSGTGQRKLPSSASLAFERGIHRWPVNSPHKGPVTRKMFPLDDVIMCKKSKMEIRHPDSRQMVSALSLHQLHGLKYILPCDGVSHHRCLDCLLSRLFRRKSKNTSRLRVTSLCQGNSMVTYGNDCSRSRVAGDLRRHNARYRCNDLRSHNHSLQQLEKTLRKKMFLSILPPIHMKYLFEAQQ